MINENNTVNLFLLKLKSKKRDDLTVRQLLVLIELQYKPQTVRGLAATLDMQKPVITRAMDKLCGDGLAVRTPDPQDRRSVVLRITPSGKKFLKECGV